MGRAVPARAPRALALGMACLATLLPSCTVGPSQRPPVAVRGENLPAPPVPPPTSVAPGEAFPEPQGQNASIPFSDCTADALAALGTPVPPDRTLRVECGELTVPADPDQPGLGGATLGVVRAGLADAPADRPPLLMLGDSASEASARHATVLATQVAPALLQSFTLIGLDRRGAGIDSLDCAPPDARAALLDAAAGTEAELSVLLERARSVVQECTLTLDGALGTFRSSSTAGDVEQLRATLGVERLSAVGVGDGAAALAGWARARPGAVGRLVLDGPPDPTLDEPERSEARAAATEAAVAAFAVDCAARPGCPLGADPRTTITALVTQLRGQPLAAPDGRRLTAGAAVNALLDRIGEPRDWPALQAALAAAGAGDPVPLLRVLDTLAGPGGRFDGRLAVRCNDTRRRLAPGEIADLAARWGTAYPLVGSTFAMRLLACAPWPTGGPSPAAGQAGDAPPILVIGTAADPRASLEGSRRASETLPTARFLSWQGSGTGAYPRTPCVSGVVDGMLLGGVVPRTGVLCPP